MLRCKFQVESVQVNNSGDSRLLTLSACIDESGDNQDWSKWTPSGRFSIDVTNPAAFPRIDAMKVGDVHFIDLSDAI